MELTKWFNITYSRSLRPPSRNYGRSIDAKPNLEWYINTIDFKSVSYPVESIEVSSATEAPKTI